MRAVPKRPGDTCSYLQVFIDPLELELVVCLIQELGKVNGFWQTEQRRPLLREVAVLL
jgi:hypothetical protein